MDDVEIVIVKYFGKNNFAGGYRFIFQGDMKLEIGKIYYILAINNVICAFVEY